MPLDTADRKLLRLLQKNAVATTHTLSEQMNLSASQVGRRKARLEEEGYITGYHARLYPPHMGLAVQAFVQVQIGEHRPERHENFLALARSRNEITAAWTLTGEADYMLRVYCTDLAALNHLVQEVLLPHASVSRVQSQIVMDQFKADTGLPT